MSPADRLKVLLFLALFFGAAGFLFMLLSCGTEYWLLAAESCDGGSDSKHVKDVKIFHEGLFWRCSYVAASDDYSIWDIWISNQPLSKVCHAAFLFPFPAHEPVWGKPDSVPSEPYEHPSAIVFRTFWSIFLTTGVMAVVIGGFFVICAAPLTNHKLYRVGGALHICGVVIEHSITRAEFWRSEGGRIRGLCLLVVMVMYLMWVQVLDTLEQFVHRKASSCPSFHLSIQHGPSFLLAPVAVFFCLLAGLLFVLMGQSVQGMELDQTDKTPERSASEL